MAILENFENAWDVDFQEEPQPPVNTNNLQNQGIQELTLDEQVIDL
jgi:hypothetical protein